MLILILLLAVQKCLCILVGDTDHAKLLELDHDLQMLKSELAHLKTTNGNLNTKLSQVETENNRLRSKISVLEKEIEPKQSVIAFHARLDHSIRQPSAGHQIVFETVNLNEGNAYNNIHGVFVAPINGTYHFALEFSFPPTSPNAYHYTHILLKKGTQPLGRVYSDGVFTNWIKRSTTVLTELKAGDDVYAVVEAVSGSQEIGGAEFRSTFAGFLVK